LISICAYKSPQMTSVDPLSSSCSRHHWIDGINCRTPQSLRASPVKSANNGEPRAPSSLLTFLPRPGAPPWPPPWFNPIAIWRGRPQPKNTVAPHLSSRLPSSCLEAIEEEDHAPESAAPSCILSCHRRHLEAVVASLESNQSRLAGEPRRKPSHHDEHSSHLSPSVRSWSRGWDQTTYRRGTWRSKPSRSH
jgi:hypothetical protein